MRWDWKALVAVVIAAVAAGWLLTRSAREPEPDDLGDVETDLAELSQALRAEAATDVDLIARASAGIHLPNVVKYRRPADFWRPVIGGSRRGRR